VDHVDPLRKNTPPEEDQAPSKSLYFSEGDQEDHIGPLRLAEEDHPGSDLIPFGNPRETGEDPAPPVPCRACGGTDLDPDGVCRRCHPPAGGMP
jgi:hypothetical protein